MYSTDPKKIADDFVMGGGRGEKKKVTNFGQERKLLVDFAMDFALWVCWIS